MARSRVVFPPPLGPTMETKDPLLMDRSTRSSAASICRREREDLAQPPYLYV